MRVRVYKNLHTGTLSMQTYVKGKGWRVHSHPLHVQLSDVKFLVYEAGRKRVLKEKRKNVHAYVEGTLESLNRGTYVRRAKYNPYKFVTWLDDQDRDITNVDHNWSFAAVSVVDGVTFAPTRWL